MFRTRIVASPRFGLFFFWDCSVRHVASIYISDFDLPWVLVVGFADRVL